MPEEEPVAKELEEDAPQEIAKQYDVSALNNILNMTKTLGVAELWADSGCRKGVGGAKAHAEVQALYKKLGLVPVKLDKICHFAFGNGDPATSTITWLYPIFIHSTYKGNIPIAEVPGVCPMLFSMNMMTYWGVVIDANLGETRSEKVHFKVPFKKGNNGSDTPYIPMLQVGDLADLSHMVPKEFRLQ